MTVTTTLDRQYFTGDGSNKNFPFNFKFFDNSQIYVFLISPGGDPIGKVLNVDYTITGALLPSGGMVTMAVAPPLNYRLLVQRIISPTQPSSIRNQGAFFPAIHEDVFDRLTMLVQQSLANDAVSIQLDRSGMFWDFMGHRAINAADPVNPQDLVTKSWAASYIDGISGQINTTTGIAYDGGNLFDFLKFGAYRTVDSIAALRALAGTRNQRAFVLGYNAKADGGGGEYYIDPADTTTADNGGSVIVGGDGSRWKFVPRIETVRPEQFGVFESVADNTVQFNKMLASPYTIDGLFRTYKISTGLLRSGQQMYRLNAESVGWVGAPGPQSMQPVFFSDGRTSSKRNMYFEDVRVNGKRELFDNITFANGEDGGLHGFAFKGDHQNIVGVRCHGFNCGTAGMMMHHPTPSATVTEYKLRDFRWIDCEWYGNREHGFFGDSLRNLQVKGGRATGNGLNIDASAPLQSGLRGATIMSGGVAQYFGYGWDIEGYAVGSGVDGILIEDLDCRGNAAPSALFYDNTPSNATGFEPRRNIVVKGGKYDLGVLSPITDSDVRVPLKVFGNYIPGVKPYSNMSIEGIMFEGAPYFIGVSKLDVSGGFVNSSTRKGYVYNCDFWTFSAPGLNNNVEGNSTPVVVLARDLSTGSPGVTFTPSQRFVRSLPDGAFDIYLEGILGGGLVAGGPIVYSIAGPAGYLVEKCTVSAKINGSRIPSLTDSELLSSGNVLITINAVSDNLVVHINVTVCPRV